MSNTDHLTVVTIIVNVATAGIKMSPSLSICAQNYKHYQCTLRPPKLPIKPVASRNYCPLLATRYFARIGGIARSQKKTLRHKAIIIFY